MVRKKEKQKKQNKNKKRNNKKSNLNNETNVTHIQHRITHNYKEMQLLSTIMVFNKTSLLDTTQLKTWILFSLKKKKKKMKKVWTNAN